MLMATLPVLAQSLLTIIAISVGDNNSYNLIGMFASKPNIAIKILMSLMVLFELTTSIMVMVTSRKGAKAKGKALGRKVSLILAIYVIVVYVLAIVFMFVRSLVNSRASPLHFSNNIVQFLSSPFVLAAMIMSVVQLFRLRKMLK